MLLVTIDLYNTLFKKKLLVDFIIQLTHTINISLYTYRLDIQYNLLLVGAKMIMPSIKLLPD